MSEPLVQIGQAVAAAQAVDGFWLVNVNALPIRVLDITVGAGGAGGASVSSGNGNAGQPRIIVIHHLQLACYRPIARC